LPAARLDGSVSPHIMFKPVAVCCFVAAFLALSTRHASAQG
jgi:hypothetical protein